MQQYITLLCKFLRLLYNKLRIQINHFYTLILLYTNNVKYKSFYTNGVPYIMIARGGTCIIDDYLKMNNGMLGNPIGRPQRCILFVDSGAVLKIGKNVGLSSSAIIAHINITIGNNVKMGGGVCIYDTDFHALNAQTRNDKLSDHNFKKNSPVRIEDNVFIGAHVTILKGVIIGENSIVGACSVVTKSIPANEVWGGNPARFIKKI